MRTTESDHAQVFSRPDNNYHRTKSLSDNPLNAKTLLRTGAVKADAEAARESKTEAVNFMVDSQSQVRRIYGDQRCEVGFSDPSFDVYSNAETGRGTTWDVLTYSGRWGQDSHPFARLVFTDSHTPSFVRPI